jgi:group I intron endonuclease
LKKLQERIYTIDYILENEIDKKAYGFIYITTNLINGKKYIGQRKFNQWKTYLGSGTVFKKSLAKYGKESFNRDIIAFSYSQKESNELEKKLIKKYNAVLNDNFYNIADGGKQSNTVAGKTSEEIKEIRKKQSNSLKGKLLGIKNPMYGKKGYWYGKKLSNIHIHNAVKNKIMKPIGKYNPRAKRIILLNTMEIFDTIKEASIKYNINHADISSCCKGKFNYIGRLENGTRLVWAYYEDFILMTGIEIIEKLDKSKSRHKTKKIICLTTNQVFNSITEASEKTKVNYKSISMNLRHKQEYAGKCSNIGEPLKWMYYTDYISQQNNQVC